MGRICGCISPESCPEEIAAFLSRCYPLKKPDTFQEAYHIKNDVALGSEGTGSYCLSPDGRFACIVDGNVYIPPQTIARIQEESDNSMPASPARVLLDFFLQEDLKAFDRLPGGFVFAIWDSEEKRLILGRDRWGIKRIYYSKLEKRFIFSSNLTALVRTPGFDRNISRDGFIDYMTYGYVPPPNTIYEKVMTLNPGEYLVFKDNHVKIDCFHPLEPADWRYQDTKYVAEDELADRLDKMLIDSVVRRLSEGREAAVYLSGGLDTSLLCAVLKRHTDKNVIAYTLGSKDPKCNEVPQAQAIAKHLDVDDHQSYYIQKDDFFEALYAMPEIYGQPFADISAIPNYVIARNVARNHDEVFAGDGPDFMYGGVDFRLWFRYYRFVPYLLRIPLSKFFNCIFNVFYRKWISPNIHISELLRQPEFFWIFHKKFKSYELERLLEQQIDPDRFWLYKYLEKRKDIPLYERLRHGFFIVFGTHGVLYKGSDIHDIFGIDFLCPYYDRELFEFVQFLPSKYKFRNGKGKYLHKRLLFRYIPRELLERPKQGFIIDYSEFGKNTLRGLTDKYLSRKTLSDTGLVNADFACQCVENYFSGDNRMGPLLWTLLIFEMWREKFVTQ